MPSRLQQARAAVLFAALLAGCGSARHTPSPTHTSAAADCPGPNLTGGAASWRTTVEPVYEAACTADEGALARLIEGGQGSVGGFATNACEGCRAGEMVALWRQEYGAGPAALARLLETAPHLSQGGITYASTDRLAVFARGAGEIPAQWSGFYPDCEAEPLCRTLADEAG
ncbi:hypothetical protein ABZ848_04890 [Streptomyces sp. NPDC047081]|uniref:hypothetical protein n=1 Tax=Streptomyces sp. NPDC047081 TaxID=3154706 RepID=UPI0033ECBDB9